MKARTVCNVPGCPTLATYRGKCDTHARLTEQARGTRQQRGYDQAHQRTRRRLAPKVAMGTVTCWRCGDLIIPGTPWDVGHDDHDRTITRGPEHAQCNRAAGGRAAHG